MKNHLYALLSLSLCAVPSAFATDPGTPVTEGMSISQVVTRLGAAKDKVEYETKRMQRWTFALGTVEFSEGAVKSWEPAQPTFAVESQPASETEAKTEDPEVSSEARAVLSEILKEIPSTPDTPTENNLGGVQLVPPPMINPIQPMPLGE